MFVTKPSNVTVPIICTSAKYAQKNSVMFPLYHKLMETREPFVEKQENLLLRRILYACKSLSNFASGWFGVVNNIALQ